jgi:PAS domain S-box-containing protein
MPINEIEIPISLRDGGEMGERIRQKDWSTTHLGPPATWPPSLRTAVSILLNSQFPMFVWWGSDLITIYNDAYINIAGEKHPHLLGTSGRKMWSEIWDVVGPLADTVMKKGQSSWSEDQLLLINRHGYIEETYFTFSYSPIPNEDGTISGLFCACTETTEKVLAARQIKESERNLRNIILQAPVAMCILKGESLIVEIANERMFELWGKSPTEMVNKPIFEGLPEAKEQGLEQILQDVYQNGVSFKADERPVQLPRKGKIQTTYLNFVYEPLRSGDGTISGVMAVGVDVTEQVIARQKIEESEDVLQKKVLERTVELERSNRSLEEFAHAASHDMKEPIRKIHFFADSLKNSLSSKLSPTETRMFERMENATKRMGMLIDDLLEYSHASYQPHQMDEIDLNEKIKKVLEDLELTIDEKKAIIIVEELPKIKGFRRQLQQLFHNLISNALKYNNPRQVPEIKICSRLVQGSEVQQPFLLDQQNKTFHLIEVRDNGIGFEPQNSEIIFQMFQRLHGKSEYPGSGVGLSIARKVVENHNGYIWAESKPEQGANFKILLPA